MKPLPDTNEEKTQVLTVRAKEALLKSAGADWQSAKNAVDKAAGLELSALNWMRDCGLKLREAAGREQIGFQWYHTASKSLPKSMTFPALKFCVHLSRNFEKRIETIDEARSARQMLFEAFGHSETPRRIEEQVSHETNPWNDFVSMASSFTSLFSKLECDHMDKWDSGRLKKFLTETEPIALAHEKARSLFEFYEHKAKPGLN